MESKPRKPKPAGNHVSVVSTKHEVLYLKVDPEFIGATFEVYDSAGVSQFIGQIHLKRTLIDFFYLEQGTYTVRFIQGDIVEDYRYTVIRKKIG